MSSLTPAGLQPHRRILASAGTGKTYSLVGRYLELVSAGADPRTVLATTFTRAAAAEIRDRVLRDSAQAVLDESVRQKLSDRGIGNGAFDHTAASEVLSRLVTALPSLQIRTLDSLFAGIIRGFGESVGMSSDARLLEAGEEKELLEDAIEIALAQGDDERFLDTLETIGRGGQKVGVISVLMRTVEEILTVAERAADDAWQWPFPKGPSREDIVNAKEALRALVTEDGKKSINNAITSLLDDLEPFDEVGGETWMRLLGKKFVPAALGDGMYSRTHLSDEVLGPLRVIADAAVAGNRQNLAQRTKAIHDLVSAISPALMQLKRRLGVVTFHDLVRGLDEAQQDSSVDLQELWFRLDGRISHLLLDEFQDTSVVQWRAIQPIAEEIASYSDGSRSLFAVGDLKQSIYGWRGGEPGILEELSQVCGGLDAFVEENLEHSWRSGPAIIDTVNEVFESIAENPSLAVVSPAAAVSFADWFFPHSTQRTDRSGVSRLEILPPATEDVSAEEIEAEAAADSVKELVARHGRIDDEGGPAVAVLVRRNKRIGPIVEAIRRRGIPASGRGGGSLLDADAAVVVLQAFRWAASPLDSVAAYDVARSPLGKLLDIESPSDAQALSKEDLQRVSNALRSRIDREGPAAMVDDWRRQLEPQLDERDRIRLRQLVEFFEGVAATVNDPEVLVHLARHARVDDPAAEGVVVMNVHQAKGLEFEGVVMTDLGQGIAPRQPSLAWEDPDTPISEIKRICTWYAEGARPEDVVPAHEQSIARMVREKLCGLYVALTRARRDLIMQVPPPALSSKGAENKTTQATLGGILRNALTQGEDISELSTTEPTVVWQSGEEGSLRSNADVEIGAERLRPKITMAQSSQTDSHQYSTSVASKPSGMFDLDMHSRTDGGTAVHACFELIEWLDEGVPSEEELDQAILGACPRRDLAWRTGCREDFLKAVASDEIRNLLSHPGGHFRVFREQPLIHTTAEGIESVVIDRLILAYDQGGDVVGADVIDFKTDQGLDEEALVSRHINQLRRYVEVVGMVFGIPNDKIVAQLAHVDQGRVHRVPIAGRG